MCNGKKTCWNCAKGGFIKGDRGTYWDPPTPDEIECQAPMTEKELEDMDYGDKWSEFDSNAEGCKYYEPQMHETCRHCGNPINQPVYDYPQDLLVCGMYDEEESAVCSKECKQEFEKAERDEYEKDQELERQAIEDYRRLQEER